MVAESKRGWAAGAAAIAGFFMAAPANAAYEEELSGSGPVLLSNVAYGDAPAPAPAGPAASSPQKAKAKHSAQRHRRGTRQQSHASRQGRSSRHRAAPVKALGSNVPYDAAVQLVCPNGWTVDSRAHSDRRVGWNAGEPWTSVLDRISSRAGLQARVDWKNKTVTVTKASGRSAGAVKKDKFRSGRKGSRHYRSSAAASKTLLTPAAEPGRAYLARTATAGEAARAAGASEGEFCSWNSLATPHARLVAGMAVWTQAPGSAGVSQAPLPPYSPPSGDMQPAMVQAPNRLESAAQTKSISQPKTSAPAPSASAELAAPDVYGANSSFRLAPGTLIAQVSRWCDQSGYQLVWKADRDVEIVSHVQYRGSFTSSLQNLFRDLSKAGQPFRVSVYEANRVVEVNES